METPEQPEMQSPPQESPPAETSNFVASLNPLTLLMAAGAVGMLAAFAFVLMNMEEPVQVTIAAVIDPDIWQDTEGVRYRLYGYDAPAPGRTHESWPEGYKDECVMAYKALRDGKAFTTRLLVGHKLTLTASYGVHDELNMVSGKIDNKDVGELLLSKGFVKPWRHDENGNPLEPKPTWCGFGSVE